MKRLLTILCLPAALLLLSSTEGWSLPPCEGSDDSTWTNCSGTFTSANGNKYVGEWKDDKQHGHGTYTRADGAKYVGEWKDGTGHGQGTYTHADGTVKKGTFRNGEFLE